MRLIKNRKGFTLMEVVVSIGIMALLLSLFLVNYRVGSRGSELVLAAQNALSDMRLVQNNSLGSVRYNGQVPLGGWGVHFDTSASNNRRYIVFADIDGDHNYDGAGESNPSYGGRTIDLPENISIAGIEYHGGISKTWSDFVFLPPLPKTIIWDGAGTTTEATIILEHGVTGENKSIYSNIHGLLQIVHP
jgi:prepilin-type N-terminal cleavage/methylation domain-containing protein